MARYFYRVFESCGNGFMREVIFPDGRREFDSLSSARAAARAANLGDSARVCRYHPFRGLEDRDYKIS